MIVYAESNFVLELAYLQDEQAACEQLLDLARGKELELVIPGCCLTEPYETLERRIRERKSLSTRLDQELKQLSRSSGYSANKGSFEAVTAVLVESIEEQRNSLDSVIRRILTVARIIPTTLAIVWDSLEIKKEPLGLTPQDAFVYTSILNDLPQGPKCFITKDRTGFANPDIEQELALLDCKLLWSFEAGLGYARSKLQC